MKEHPIRQNQTIHSNTTAAVANAVGTLNSRRLALLANAALLEPSASTPTIKPGQETPPAVGLQLDAALALDEIEQMVEVARYLAGATAASAAAAGSVRAVLTVRLELFWS